MQNNLVSLLKPAQNALEDSSAKILQTSNHENDSRDFSPIKKIGRIGSQLEGMNEESESLQKLGSGLTARKKRSVIKNNQFSLRIQDDDIRSIAMKKNKDASRRVKKMKTKLMKEISLENSLK